MAIQFVVLVVPIERLDMKNWPAGDGEMATLIRTFDWSKTSLGPIEGWPLPVRTITDLLLGCGFPMIALWGPELIQVYNNGYRDLMRIKHPDGLGKGNRECWPEVWHINEAIYQRVWNGETVTYEDALYPLARSGDIEETYLTLTYGPIHGENAEVIGVLVTMFETTARVVAERNLRREEQYQAFLLNLSDALRPLSEPKEIRHTAAMTLGTALDAAWVYYGEYDRKAGDITIGADFSKEGEKRLAGSYPTASLDILARLQEGKTVAINDIFVSSLVSDACRSQWAALGLRSFLAVPILKSGALVAVLVVADTVIRDWTSFIRTVEETATRTLAAAEQARAQNALAESERRLRENEIWLAAQKDAFQAAMNGAPLSDALDVLLQTTASQMRGQPRCAFYINNGNGGLRHVVGMSDIYAHQVDNFRISPESLACGMAVAIKQPVITPDVRDEPRWAPWLWLAEEHEYRACWSFPVETDSGNLVGSLALYHSEPCSPDHNDYDVAARLTQAAAILISRHMVLEERTQAEARLRQRDEWLAAAFEALPLAITVVDLDGKVLLSNKELDRYMPTGIMPSRDDERSWRWRSWDENDQLLSTSQFPGIRGLRGERIVPGVDMLYTQDDGRDVWTNVAVVPLKDKDQKVTGQVTVISDVDTVKRGTAALKESEERFQQFGQASQSAIWIRDAKNFAFEYVSPAVRAIYGVSEDDLMRDERLLGACVVPEERQIFSENVKRVSHGETVTQEYLIQRTTDREFRWIRSVGFPILDDNGDITRTGGIAEDITEAKLASEHQSILLAELQHRVRNIMAMIRSIAYRTGDGAQSVMEYRDLVSGRLLALARVQALLTRAANLDIGIETIVESELRAQAEHEEQYKFSGPNVVLSPKAAEILTLALHELSTNALKYGALSVLEGQVTVTWKVEDRRRNPWLIFDWIETCAGLPRLEPGKPRRRGFGAELIEGKIPYELRGRASMKLNSDGLHCHIEFPIKQGDSILETDAPVKGQITSGLPSVNTVADLTGHTVLVVEDDFYLSLDIARALQAAGATVVGPFADETSAMKCLSTETITGALLDINLGHGPSFTLAEALMRTEIPFIFTTGYDDNAIPEAFDHILRLRKPVQFGEVINAFAEISPLK